MDSMTKQSVFAFVIAIGLLTPVSAAPAESIEDSETRAPARVREDADERADRLYEEGRDAIESGKYDRAIERFNRVIEMKTGRTDAALYWKAYSLAKLGQRAEALTTLADLQKQFGDSRWIKDAKALEIEVRQASGQPVSPASQSDDDLKMMALNGIMESDPDSAIPILQQLLNGSSSLRVKDRALFVLSQSRSSRARELIGTIAKGGSNPDLQLRAIKYLGIMGGDENRQILAEVYVGSSDSTIKRSILRSFMVSGDRTRLFDLAKNEKDVGLRGEAVQQLGVMGAHAELAQLYQTETSVEVKKKILQAMFVGGDSTKLGELAKGEKDPELRKTAIHNLGLMGTSRTGDTLREIYTSDASPEIRKAVIQGLFLQNNAKTLVELARAEKSVELKKEIVSKLSLMPQSKEAKEYLLELLK
jgi:HEAT repeat protein